MGTNKRIKKIHGYSFSDLKRLGFNKWIKGFKPIHLCWLFERLGLPIPKYLVGGGSKPPVYASGNIDNATRNLGNTVNTPVTNWTKTNDFIVAIALEAQSGANMTNTNCRLEWRNKSDGGTFAVFSGSGELQLGATDLVEGNSLTSGEAICTPVNGTTYVAGSPNGGVEKESNSTFTAGDGSTGNQWSEFQISVDADNALDSKEYEFRVYDVDNSVVLGPSLATLTTAAGAFLEEYTGSGEINVSGVASTEVNYSVTISIELLKSKAIQFGNHTLTQINILLDADDVLKTSAIILEPTISVSSEYSASGEINVSGVASTEATADYEYSASGEIEVSGVASTEGAAYLKEYTASGEVSVSGVASTEGPAYLKEYSASGEIKVSGVASTEFLFAYSASGEVSVSGVASTEATADFEYSASGEVNVSGVATTEGATYTKAYSASGEVNVSGVATTEGATYTKAYSASGEVNVSGVAETNSNVIISVELLKGKTIHFGTLIGTDIYLVADNVLKTSAIILTPTISTTSEYTGSGEVNVSGVATTELGTAYNASGEIEVSGIAATELSFDFAYSASGEVKVNGVAETEATADFEYSASGEIEVSGVAETEATADFEYSGSGEVNISGVTTTEFVIEFIYTPSGEINVSGVATTELGTAYVGSGEIKVSGIASISKNFWEYSASGEIVVSGVAETKSPVIFEIKENLIFESFITKEIVMESHITKEVRFESHINEN